MPPRNQAEYDAQEHPDCYAREPGEYPCIDCGADVGESAIAWELHGRIAPRSECPECSEPLCSKCADKDSEISERCAKCAGQEVKEQGR
jgi:DNA-directed RNA polymerase subunit RPC12/RpoP